jgi:hypothetical protein
VTGWRETETAGDAETAEDIVTGAGDAETVREKP